MTAAAVGSLAGFVTSVALYAYVPLPSSGVSWATPRPWISVVLLGVGLTSFIVLLITGLITLLNRGSDRPPQEREQE
ncbi:MAG TPA: hypothetical protein VEH10_05155 [Thermoplasmata archaeon]|nr:hypothetical protein [Thermoplasmata archaeon]